MKWKTVIVLLFITLGIMVPPSLPLVIGHEARIGTLDVCRSATPAISSQGDMPCVSECPCHLPAEGTEIGDTPAPLFKPLLIVFQDEHPPKA